MIQTHTRALRAVTSAGLLVASSPVLALAEEENTGLKLLKPNMAEFIPACVAFLIIWLVMAKLVWPMILKAMDERENKIKSDLDAAAEAHSESDRLLALGKARLDEAKRQADDIVEEAKRDAKTLRAEMIAEAQQESQAIVAKANDVIEAERIKAMSELSKSVIDLSVEISSKIIGDALDEDAQRALAAKYLSEVGSLNDD